MTVSAAPPQVSVVIPMHNSASTIETALKSVACQTYRNLQIIVIDDGSTDGGRGLAENLLSQDALPFQILRLDAQQGAAAARNVGLKAATGDLIAFLDADDEWLPAKIEKQLDLMTRYPDVVLCGCQGEIVDEEGRRIDRLFDALPTVLEDGWKELLWNTYISTPSAMVRRSALPPAWFREDLIVGEDRDLWIRIAERGRVGLVQESLVRIVLSPHSLSAREGYAARGARDLIYAHVERFGSRLSRRERARARGSADRIAGKALSCTPQTYRQGRKLLIRAMMSGTRPVDCGRMIILAHPAVKAVRRQLERFK